MRSTSITDEGIETILKFKDLKDLNLAGVQQVTDDGFAKLVELKNLTRLNVANTNIGYDSLDLLEESNDQLELIDFE